jgi:hypothetical protein
MRPCRPGQQSRPNIGHKVQREIAAKPLKQSNGFKRDKFEMPKKIAQFLSANLCAMQNISVRDGKLLTEEQLAKALETSVYNVRHLRHRKKIPFIRLGHRSIRFDLIKVRKALERYEVEEVA